METNQITEKVYCYDHPSAYNNHDALAIAAMANRRGNDCDGNGMWPMMAMMGGGFGMNQWMNNPFAYMMMVAWMRNFNGGWGEGGWGMPGQNAQNIEMQNQLQAIRTQLQDNQNIQLLRQAIGDGFQRNEFALSQLSQNLNIDFNTLQKCCCDVQAAIQQVAGQVGFSAERVINAVNMGDCGVIQALKDCCCQTQRQIADFRADVQLQTCQQTGELRNGQRDLGQAITQGFSATAFQAQQDKCDIISAGKENTQRIIDTLNGHWNNEQALALQDEKFKNSQLQQNIYVRDLMNGKNCGCGCNNNGCGCGCGM